MSLPKTYEVVFKTESVASDPQDAIAEAKRKIAQAAGDSTMVRYGVVRDDSLFDGRVDEISRHTNHLVVLDPKERQELQNIVHKLGSLSPLPEAERFRLLERAVRILDCRESA